MVEGLRMCAISLLTILLLLPLLSAAPLDIAGDIKKVDVKADNDGLHSQDENVTRGGKFFAHNQFDIRNISISGSVAGDVVSIGHQVKIDVHGHTHDHHHHEADSVTECKEGLRELFKSIDSNKNGLMDAKELLRVCHQNNLHITESLAVRILTLPDKTVGFNLAKFCELLKDCPSTNSADLIYFLLQLFDKAVDGGWSNWSEYGMCSKSCGGGQQTRTRTCTNPVPQHKGRTCEQQNIGDPTETKDCNLHDCVATHLENLVGTWSTLFKNGFQATFTIKPDGEISLFGRKSVLEPSDDQVNFPSSEGWMKADKVLRDETWSYCRIAQDGSLEVEHFHSDENSNPNNFQNLDHYCCRGVGFREVTCHYKDDLSSVLLENNWRTPDQIDVMSEDQKRNIVIVEVEKMTGHTTEDLQKRANADDLGSLASIANMAAFLIKYLIRSSSEVKTMTYEPDLRNTLIVETSQRFSTQIGTLQSMTDHQLLKKFFEEGARCGKCECEQTDAEIQNPSRRRRDLPEGSSQVATILTNLAGIWSVEFTNGATATFTINPDREEISWSVRNTLLKPSDDQVNFPSSEGWMKGDKLFRDTTWNYYRIEEDGTLKVEHFYLDGLPNSNNFQNLDHYCCSGIGHRQVCEADKNILGGACMCDGTICDVGATCTSGKTCTPAATVICPYKDDLDSVIVENKWRTQDEIDVLSEGTKRNIAVIEIRIRTRHTTEDLGARANAGDFGSLAAIANMVSLLIKYLIRSSSEVKTLTYGDLRNILIIETSNRFPIPISVLQQMTDNQLLKRFCTVCTGCPADETLTSECMCGGEICSSGGRCASGSRCIPKDRLLKGQKLLGEEILRSQNEEYDLVMQSDGNLVIYDNFNGRIPIWSTASSGAGSYLIFSLNGDLAIYEQTKKLWNTYTYSESASSLVMQNDGNLVLYGANNVLWASHTAVPEIEMEFYCPSGIKFTSKIVRVASRLKQSCKACWERPDGCSVPEDFTITKKELNDYFLTSCDIHDLCYGYIGRSKDDCDKEFHHNMLKQCEIKEDWTKKLYCQSLAHSVYVGVSSDLIGDGDTFDLDPAGNGWDPAEFGYNSGQEAAKTCILR